MLSLSGAARHVKAEIISIYVGSDQLSPSYGAADLFILLPRAIICPLPWESMACWDPVCLCFFYRLAGAAGTDAPRHHWLSGRARRCHRSTLTVCIAITSKTTALRHAMKPQRCRTIALMYYPLESYVQRYLALYSQVLAKARHDVPGSAALV